MPLCKLRGKKRLKDKNDGLEYKEERRESGLALEEEEEEEEGLQVVIIEVSVSV
jgi:hypothetical protein